MRRPRLQGQHGSIAAGGAALERDLKSALMGRAVIVGVGTDGCGDDAAGPEVVRLLMKRGVDRAIDAGASPEIETWRIREMAPDCVLFVDAVDFGGDAGEVALLAADDLRADGWDTHRAPIRLTMRYLEAELGCGCRLLAIQPRSVRRGAPMSEEVRQTVAHAALALCMCLNG